MSGKRDVVVITGASAEPIHGRSAVRVKVHLPALNMPPIQLGQIAPSQGTSARAANFSSRRWRRSTRHGRDRWPPSATWDARA
jgi:hypothetical protein